MSNATTITILLTLYVILLLFQHQRTVKITTPETLGKAHSHTNITLKGVKNSLTPKL